MINFNCPYCKLDLVFEKHQQKGAHLVNCNQNPKRKESIAKQIKTSTKPRIALIKNCLKCDAPFTQYKTQGQIDRNKQKDIASYCSRKCANSHIVSDEHKEKISLIMKDKYVRGELDHTCIGPNSPKGHKPKGYKHSISQKLLLNENRICIICSNNFECKQRAKRQTCSKECLNKLISKKLKGSGKIGGYKVKSGTSKFHGNYYKDIWMDSSWEIALAKRLDQLNIIWARDNMFFNYVDINGEKRKYYPDFYLPDYNLYIECKGYWTDTIRHKIENVVSTNHFTLVILDSIKLINNFFI